MDFMPALLQRLTKGMFQLRLNLDLKKIIGIATEPLSANYRSYDGLGLRDVKFENRDDLVEQAKIFFSKPYRPEITEYKGRIGYA